VLDRSHTAHFWPEPWNPANLPAMASFIRIFKIHLAQFFCFQQSGDGTLRNTDPSALASNLVGWRERQSPWPDQALRGIMITTMTETCAPPPAMSQNGIHAMEVSSQPTPPQPRISTSSSTPVYSPAPFLHGSTDGPIVPPLVHPQEEPTCMQSLKQDMRNLNEYAASRYSKLTWRAIRAFCQRRLPITEWIPEYRLWKFIKDLQAGLVVACMLIPQGMGYADVAGLPFVAGRECISPCFVRGFHFARI
jgi:hypothetical protein